MKFPGAKYGLKMACGENPKRVYAQRGPVDAHGQRRRLSRGVDQGRDSTGASGTTWNADQQGRCAGRAISRLETLAEVLRGNILVHNHCYRADEMAQMIDIAHEFGYKIRSFHHGVEAYKIADLLAKEGISASLWADWGGFKMEAIDGVKREPARSSTRAGVARDRALRRSVGIAAAEPGGGEGHAPPATAIGIAVTDDERSSGSRSTRRGRSASTIAIGTIETGKNADVVLWSANPFSVYARAEKVWIDGALMFDRLDPAHAVAHRFRARIRAAGAAERRDEAARAALSALRSLSAPAAAQTIAITGGKVYPVASRRSRTPPSSSSTAKSPRSAPTSRCPPAPSASTRRANGSRQA